jgi:hypothetical protein
MFVGVGVIELVKVMVGVIEGVTDGVGVIEDVTDGVGVIEGVTDGVNVDAGGKTPSSTTLSIDVWGTVNVPLIAQTFLI